MDGGTVVILLAPNELATRRAVIAGPLAPLAESLAADLARVREAPLFVPPEKARMTRVGGRCATDGTLLGFDPFSPRRHVCPACGREYTDDAHYRWWIMWYQLWLAERAVHGAALAALAGDADAGAFARDVLDAYADRYSSYPNQDNVLGPTRLFFSTYLESIWLLQICVALDLLEMSGDSNALGGRVRERIVEPSRRLIASYDEKGSNRQVWNAAALAAAARVMGDDAALERAVLGSWGVRAHLECGLLADGTWYEGENYHQFAHRGLWYGVTIAERAGIVLPPSLRTRFDDGFVAPFLTALPDFTLPARRDSQWAISLRQWRFAESCELGLARGDDRRLTAALARLYAPHAPVPRRDTGRWRTAAESERNEPPTRLSRADLGWRSLLHARAELPDATAWAATSVLLPAQGVAVFRRDGGERFMALDYGTSGGGHGHPDRLNVLLADGERRWLDDMGTGSYVERTLHWYRSTLAHNAPLVNGASQARNDGALLSYDERGDWGWARASAEIAPGVRSLRSLVVGPCYAIDRVRLVSLEDATFDLPIHVDAEVANALDWRDATLRGAGGLEDGFGFLTDVRAATLDAGVVLRLRADAGRAIAARRDAEPLGGPACAAWIFCDHPATVYRAMAPSSPGRAPKPFYVVRVSARQTVITTVWDTRETIADVAFARDAIVVTGTDERVERHGIELESWTVASDGASVTLAGTIPVESVEAPVEFIERVPRVYALPHRFALGEAEYRPSESSWRDAGSPSATVDVRRDDDRLTVRVHVVTPHPTFAPVGVDNPLDNERAEINGDGVQLYLRPIDGAMLGWLLAPVAEREGDVRRIPLDPRAERVPLDARWARERDGWSIDASLALGDVLRGASRDCIGFDVLVNETAPGRERRRGQLVLSGTMGESVYLQGDRHDPARLVTIALGA